MQLYYETKEIIFKENLKIISKRIKNPCKDFVKKLKYFRETTKNNIEKKLFIKLKKINLINNSKE